MKDGRGRKPIKRILQDGAAEEEVVGAFRQRDKALRPQSDNEVALGNVRIPAVGEVRGGAPPSDMQLESIPAGPYKTQGDKWASIIKLQDINIRRRRGGWKFLNEKDVQRRMGMTALEIEKEVHQEGYKKLRLAKAASHVQQSIADIAPIVRRTLQDVSGQMENMPACSVCGRDSVMNLDKKQEFLEFVVTVMDKFGLKTIDTSAADQSDEMDTEEAIAEAVKIIEEAKTWPNLAPQRVVAALVTRRGGTDTRSKKQKATETHKDSGAFKGDVAVGPDAVVRPVRVSETPVPEQEKVSGDDKLEPPGEVRVVDGGSDAVRAGEAPGGEDTQERSGVDIGQQERQGTSGVAPEVPGETGAERIQVELQRE